jgi:hypothetical protein
MSKAIKISVVAFVCSCFIGGLSNSASAKVKPKDDSFWCCLGWGKLCKVTCTNVPGQTQEF